MKQFIIGALLLAFCGLSYADDNGGEDIYPDGFMSDCQAVTKDVAVCYCSSKVFFSKDFEDTADAYRIYIETIQGKPSIEGKTHDRLEALRDVNQCRMENSHE